MAESSHTLPTHPDRRAQDKRLRSELVLATISAAENGLIAAGERLARACSVAAAAGHKESQPLHPARL